MRPPIKYTVVSKRSVLYRSRILQTNHFQEQLVQPEVIRKFGMESGDEHPVLPGGDRMAFMYRPGPRRRGRLIRSRERG